MGARFYDSSKGSFIQQDRYMGDPSDPLSLNRYVYCGLDPVNYVDPTGFNYVLLNMRNAGAFFGHDACMVGNDNYGWRFYSTNGTDKAPENLFFGTFNEFQKSGRSAEFTGAYEVQTTAIQDAMMITVGNNNYDFNYSIPRTFDEFGNRAGQNCADLCSQIGAAGGLNVPDPSFLGLFTWPNAQFDQFTTNPGEFITPHIDN